MPRFSLSPEDLNSEHEDIYDDEEYVYVDEDGETIYNESEPLPFEDDLYHVRGY